MNTRKRGFKAFIAALLAGALLFGSPGLEAYQAFAAQVHPAGEGAKGAPLARVNFNVGQPAADAAAFLELLGQKPVGPLLGWDGLKEVEPKAPAMERGVAPIFGKSASQVVGQVVQTFGNLLAKTRGKGGQVVSADAAVATASREAFDGLGHKTDDVVLAAAAGQDHAPGLARAPPIRISKAAVGIGLGVAVAAAAVGCGGHAVAAHAAGSSLMPVVDHVGRWAYYVGNFLGFTYSIPQIYRSLDRNNRIPTPINKALIGVAASFSLGFINAPLAGMEKFFWGWQNIFGGFTIMTPLLIEKFMARPENRLSMWGARTCTAVIVASTLALSHLIATWTFLLIHESNSEFTKNLTLTIQILTGLGYMWMFLSRNNKEKTSKPETFDSLVSLQFLVSSFAFMIWASQEAMDTTHMMLTSQLDPQSRSKALKELGKWLIYVVQNLGYCVVTLKTFRLSRKHEKKT